MGSTHRKRRIRKDIGSYTEFMFENLWTVKRSLEDNIKMGFQEINRTGIGQSPDIGLFTRFDERLFVNMTMNTESAVRS
jgi:hypothetical protein